MFFNRFAKRDAPYPLVVGMTGVKLGDQLLQIGCAHGGRLAAVAAKVGLSGRAVAVVADRASAARAEKAAADAGVLVDVEVVSGPPLPFDDGAFDLAIVDDTGGAFGSMRGEDRVALVREIARVVRPGGRAMVIGSVPREGLAALISRAQSGPSFAASGQAAVALESDGFRGVRTLARREGLIFIEGIKPRP